MSRTKNVGIFRIQLFKPSETFISAQASHLTNYRPTFIGRRLFGDCGEAELATPPVNTRMGCALDAMRVSVMRDPAVFTSALGLRHLDLIHAHFGVDGVFALPLADRLGVPLITTLHGFDVTRSDRAMLGSLRPALINGVLFRRDLQRRCEQFLCVSDFIRKKALGKGYPEDRLRTHYIGIDCQRVKPRSHAAVAGLILHVGRLVEQKGTSYLLQAFSRLLPHSPHARLMIIGDGPMRLALESESRRLGIQDHCRFLGALPNNQVLEWVARAAIKVVPSVTGSAGDTEGFGIVNLEAGAQAVPVVAFDSGGIAEAIVHGKTGLLCGERDVDGLTRNLLTLLANPEIGVQMGCAARERVEAKFDIRKQTALLERIYDKALRIG